MRHNTVEGAADVREDAQWYVLPATEALASPRQHNRVNSIIIVGLHNGCFDLTRHVHVNGVEHGWTVQRDRGHAAPHRVGDGSKHRRRHVVLRLQPIEWALQQSCA